MRTNKRLIRATAAAIVSVMLMLTSCWKVDADLELSDRELNFGTGMEEAILTVTNDSRDKAITSGVTPLDYTFKCDRAWVTVAPVEGHLGSEESIEHTVAIDRSELALGANVATITVTSNGGNATVTVRATRTSSNCIGAPDAASRPSPQDGAGSVALSAGLSWQDGESQCDELTASYDLYFGTTNPPPFHHNNGSRKSWDPDELAANTLYYWRVVAKDVNGSTASTTWNFRTTGTLGCEDGPEAVRSLSPDDDAVDVGLNQDLSWSGGESQCPGLTATYDVYFGDNSPPPFHHNNGSDKSWNPGALKDDETYYWRIVARDANGSTSSDILEFHTRACDDDDAIDPPCNPSPSLGKTNVNTKTSLSWQCGATFDDNDECAPDNVTYIVYLGRSTDLGEGDREGVTTTKSYKPGTLSSRTTYYWRVVAQSGDTSKSSPTWRFTTR